MASEGMVIAAWGPRNHYQPLGVALDELVGDHAAPKASLASSRYSCSDPLSPGPQSEDASSVSCAGCAISRTPPS